MCMMIVHWWSRLLFHVACGVSLDCPVYSLSPQTCTSAWADRLNHLLVWVCEWIMAWRAIREAGKAQPHQSWWKETKNGKWINKWRGSFNIVICTKKLFSIFSIPTVDCDDDSAVCAGMVEWDHNRCPSQYLLLVVDFCFLWKWLKVGTRWGTQFPCLIVGGAADPIQFSLNAYSNHKK